LHTTANDHLVIFDRVLHRIKTPFAPCLARSTR
jgi:hypothetical protein